MKPYDSLIWTYHIHLNTCIWFTDYGRQEFFNGYVGSLTCKFETCLQIPFISDACMVAEAEACLITSLLYVQSRNGISGRWILSHMELEHSPHLITCSTPKDLYYFESGMPEFSILEMWARSSFMSKRSRLALPGDLAINELKGPTGLDDNGITLFKSLGLYFVCLDWYDWNITYSCKHEIF